VGLSPPQECDVNARPELATPISPGCYPVNPNARNPLAHGPGIRIPALPVRTAPPPIPRDIAVVDLPPVSAADISKNPQSLSGQFAFLLASNDSIYILNLAPKTLDNGGLADEKALTHSFRETRASGQYAADMLVLSSTPPLRTPLSSDLLFPTTPVLAALDGPRLESVTDPTPPNTPISTNYSTTNYWANFPYPSTYVSRTFTIAWEDMLPGTARSSGVLHDALNAGTSGGALVDAGGDFCARDVAVGDLVMLPGCTLDTDCNPQDRFSCRQPVSGATGLCLPKDAGASLLERCARFSGSRRRYEILSATSTRLDLGLHLDEVPKTSLNRAAATEDTGPRDGECQPTDSHKVSGFAWKQVWTSEPYKRCVQVCGAKLKADEPASAADQDCRPGFVCADIPGSNAPSRYCVEAPPITADDLVCWPQPGNRYHVNVGNGFLIQGSALPDLKTNLSGNDKCQPDAKRDAVLASRIPMSAPVCTTIDGATPIQNLLSVSSPSTPTEVALFGQPAAATGIPNAPYTPVTPPGPNPCLYQDLNYDDNSLPVAGAGGGAGAGTPVKALFQNPQIRFVLTNLDQYGGDNLTTRLNLVGGFIPATVALPSYEVGLTQPIRLYTGPTKLPESPLNTDLSSNISYPYVYVLDQGRTALTPNSRGQIVRLNARKSDSAVTTLDPAFSGSTPFQIQ
jgi:hypothetical protein